MGEFDVDREEVLARAAEAGLEAILTVGCDLESSRRAADLAGGWVGKAGRGLNIWASVGVHPHEAARWNGRTGEVLKEIIRSTPGVVAVGETGLDFYRNISPREAQEKAFRAQVALAMEVGLPIVIHDRDAHEAVFRILKEMDAWSLGGVMHCFSGDWNLARRYLDRGFYISLAGPVTYPNAATLRTIARYVPVDKLLVETDCPYLAPQSKRGRRNEPAFVAEVVKQVAAIKGVPHDEMACATAENARALFLEKRGVES